MSSSSSSEAWSDDEPDTKKATDEPRSTPLVRPRHGEKLSFQAPPGYLPSPHSQELIDAFGRDSLKRNGRRELWIVKIPEEVSPSALDGLVINVPSTSSATLAQLKIQTPVKGSASQTQIKSYSLCNYSCTSGPKEHGTESTQLIAMAGGYASANGSDAEHGLAEADSLQVMLPQSHSQQGRYVFAHAPVKHHLRLVMDGEAQHKSSATESGLAHSVPGNMPGDKRKREQPLGKLKGSFLPAGARSKEDKANLAAGASPTKAKKAKKEKSEAKDVKKEKKRPKAQ